jgi:hypothetical protein
MPCMRQIEGIFAAVRYLQDLFQNDGTPRSHPRGHEIKLVEV